MKVTNIKSFAFEDAEGKLYFIVKVETDEGIYGLGEAGIHAGARLSPTRLNICQSWSWGKTRLARSACGSICFAADSSRRTRYIAAPSAR